MPETHQITNHTQSLPNYPGQNIHLKARPTTLTLKSARSLSNPAPQKRLVRSPGTTAATANGAAVIAQLLQRAGRFHGFAEQIPRLHDTTESLPLQRLRIDTKRSPLDLHGCRQSPRRGLRSMPGAETSIGMVRQGEKHRPLVALEAVDRTLPGRGSSLQLAGRLRGRLDRRATPRAGAIDFQPDRGVDARARGAFIRPVARPPRATARAPCQGPRSPRPSRTTQPLTFTFHADKLSRRSRAERAR